MIRFKYYTMEDIEKFAEQPITRQLILSILKKYKRPYDKVNELVKQGKLILVRRGVYMTGLKTNIKKPEPFLLANHLMGPSYISLESALSYWGLIPEKVFETTSVTTEKAAVYKTPAGRFSYTKIALPYYAFGIKQLELTPKQHVIIATPEKALFDKIITTSGLLLRSTKQAKELLMEDLRMDREVLRNLNIKKMETWIKEAPKKSSLNILIKTLKSL